MVKSALATPVMKPILRRTSSSNSLTGSSNHRRRSPSSARLRALTQRNRSASTSRIDTSSTRSPCTKSVSFATTAATADDENDTIDKGVATTTHTGLNRNEYTHEEKHACWFTEKELDDILGTTNMLLRQMNSSPPASPGSKKKKKEN